MDGQGWNSHWKVPCWHTLQRQQSFSDSPSTCSHLERGRFSHPRWPPFVASRGFTAGRKVAGEWSKAESPLIAPLGCQAPSPGRGSEETWTDGESLRSLGECLLSAAVNSLKLRATQGPAVFAGPCSGCDDTELWISGGHFL